MSQDTTIAPTVEQFLADFPRFDTSGATGEGAVQFGPDAINYWLNFAVLSVNHARFGTWYYTAVELFMAHNLALEARAEQGGDQTIPGLIVGAIASTASGDVSVSYNSMANFELGAGHWNLTIYGLRFIRMCRMVAAGPIQITGGCGWGGGAWSGPPFFNFPNPNL